MSYKPFKLSKTVRDHTNDVKAVSFVNNGDLVSCSRDGKCTLTTPDGTSTPLFESSCFLNSVAVDARTSTVFIGQQDSSIVAINLSTLEQTFYLGHTANVSCLDVSAKLLASGSWDHAVRVWKNPDDSIELTGHTQNVWAVKFVNDGTLLSASADKTIKLWDLHAKKCVKTYTGHTDVVRSIALIPNTSQFVSSSNDGTLKIWDLKGGLDAVKTLEGHTSFVYSVATYEDLIISSGEDRTVRVWYKDSCVQTVLLPSISQWTVAFNPANGDFAVGSSDNTVRVFTQSSERVASALELEQFEESLKNAAIGETEIDESYVKDPSILQTPGTQEGQVVITRINGKLETHMFSNGVWTKLGDVIGKKDSKPKFNGKEYDYVFDVDIKDGAPPLKLPFNNSDNPYVVAEKFIVDNDLPPSYVEQIVQFLIRNSQSAHASQPAASSSKPTAPSSGEVNEIVKGLKLQPVIIKAFQRDPLLRALGNDSVLKYSIDKLLDSLPSSANELLKAAVSLNNERSGDIKALLPVYDLLRISIADATQFNHQSVWIILFTALDANIPKHCLLAIRGVNNLIAPRSLDQKTQIDSKMLTQALEMIIDVCATRPTGKSMGQVLAALMLNLVILSLPYVDYGKLLLSISPVIASEGDDEALYRLATVILVLLSRDTSIGGKISLDWFARASEPQTVQLLSVIKKYAN